jgi:hypothetical protein
MHHVNDDMDEIFRRAGKEYPLDTGGGDWEKIAKELNIPAEGDARSGGGKKRFLWLLLLLPFSFICTQYFADKGNHNAGGVNPDGPASVSSAPESKRNGGADNEAKNEDQYHPAEPGSSTGQARRAGDRLNGKISPVETANAKINRGNGNVLGSAHDQERTASNNDVNTIADHTASGKDRQQWHLSSGSYPFPQISPALAKQRNIAAAAFPETRPRKKERNKRFYAGLIGGLDATAIKFQRVENAGYDLGVLAGYSFGKKWSIETGLLADKKFYYSEGEYFNTSKVYVPPNSKITSVEGNCSMWELPLSIRYNLKTSPNHSWFVTGGVSSYFMKKENYSYGYYYFSNGQTHYYDHSYESSSKTIFSVAQISGGYTRRIGKIADLRIEPYFKIPLRGVGIGSMPFQSAGIHVGLTREIF